MFFLNLSNIFVSRLLLILKWEIMKLKSKLWIVLLALIMLSCEKESQVDLTGNTKSIYANSNRDFTNSEVYILASNNIPIGNVKIKNNNDIIGITNEDGYAVLRTNVRIGSVLSFENENFITVSKIINEDTKLVIKMKERSQSITFDSNRGYKASLRSGVSIKIPDNAFNYNGIAYSGPVEMSITYINVTNPNEAQSAPGSYIAFNRERDNLYPLESFGMVEITAKIPRSDMELELRDRINIPISLPIIDNETPDRVNFYELDTETGYWIQKGILVSTGETLTGVITSVNSAWNADDPCANSLVCVKVKVVFTNGNPGCGVGATGVSYNGFDGIHTIDANGYVQLMVCPSEVFELGACWILCCGPGVPLTDPCCNNPQERTTIDMSTITTLPGPDGCIDIGTWTIVN